MNIGRREKSCRSVRIVFFSRSHPRLIISFSLWFIFLATVKEKYGSDYEEGDEEALDDDDEDSESDESEDEDGEELTPAVDAAILRTLARIRRKDPGIYESGREVFTGAFNSLLRGHIV